MSTKRLNEVNMTEGPLLGNILKVALPLAMISILQQLFNAADVAVVGRFADEAALAAVGTNTPIINMFLTFFTGLATGGNVVISTMIGSGKTKEVKKALHTVFSLALVCSLFVIVVGETVAEPMLKLINTPDTVLPHALIYLRIYFWALAFAVIYNYCSAILRSKGDTKRPLYVLVVSGIINVILNFLLVAVFKLAVAGVAIATLVANIICALVTVLLLLKEEGYMKLELKALGFDEHSLKYALKIGLPAGFQGMLFAVSNVVIQAGINSFGADCIAGNTAALLYEFAVYYIVNAFGQTATTFVSQNYGAKNMKRCKKVYVTCLILGGMISFALAGFLYINSDFFLGLFSHSKGVLEYAMIRMKYVVLLVCLIVFNDVGSGCQRGMGVSIPPTVISITGSCVLRVVWVKTMFVLFPNIVVLLLAYPASWVALGFMQSAAYIFYNKKIARIEE